MNIWKSVARRIGLATTLALAGTVGCSTPPVTDASVDTGNPDVPVVDAVADAAPSMVERVAVVPVSTTGHDRFFGVAFNASGSDFYTVGVVADSTDATADFRTVVAKFSAAGVLDTTFGTNGFATVDISVGANGEVARGIVVQSSGKIVVAATVDHVGAADPRDRDIALARFNANGTLDTTFGSNGIAIHDLSTGEVVGTSYIADSQWGMVAYSDDRLLVSGSQKRTGATDTDFAIMRFTPDGVFDTTFGTNGVATVDINNRNASARNLTLAPDGSIFGGGYMDDGGVTRPVVFKLTPAGVLDTSFATTGYFIQAVLTAQTEAYSCALQGTSLVTAGYGRNNATESLDWVSLRISSTGTLDTTWGTGGFTRIDVAGFVDQTRSLIVLPDNRVMLVGVGRMIDTNVDGMLAVLTANGARDATFGSNGVRMMDLGGMADFLWNVALSPTGRSIAIVGVRGVGTAAGNDDGVVLVLPTP